jgi:hypothetical protein
VREARGAAISLLRKVFSLYTLIRQISGRDSAGRAQAANIGASPGFSCAGERRILPEPIRGNYGVNPAKVSVKHAFMQKRRKWHCLMWQRPRDATP